MEGASISDCVPGSMSLHELGLCKAKGIHLTETIEMGFLPSCNTSVGY